MFSFKSICLSIAMLTMTMTCFASGRTDKSSAIDEALLTPEKLPMNQPLEVEPYADPDYS